MSSLLGFDIPHDKGTPVRDIITVQCPFPVQKIGSILTPATWREMSQHTHQMGVIRQLGPLSLYYNDGRGGPPTMLVHHEDGSEVKQGDWVLFKWGAGTTFLAGRGVAQPVGGYRYLSFYGDVIKVIRAVDGPDPSKLSWTDEGDDVANAFDNKKEPAFDFDARRGDTSVTRANGGGSV